MDLIKIIKDQASALTQFGSRLSGVSVTSPLDRAGAAILRTTWSQRGSEQVSAPQGVCANVYQPSTDGRIVLPDASLDDLDAEFLNMAWALGAWDVQRTEYAPLAQGADPWAPGAGISIAIMDPYRLTGLSCDEAPAQIDARAWILACARHGRLNWYCRPMWMAPEIRQRAWLAKDKTLLADGGRDQRPWRPWHPVSISADHQTIIRLGRANHGNR